MRNAVQELYSLERLSAGNTFVHKLHPTVKLLTALFYIITVVSFDRYALGGLAPFVFYPAVLLPLSETPYAPLHKRFLIALPFCFFAGISNLFFDRAAAFTVGGFIVSGGALSFSVIILRAYLCVIALLILVSVTPLAEITGALRRLRIPRIFVTILEMTYRYIGVLMEEAYSMYTAYALRSGGGKGVALKHMGNFAGQLLLRSFDRADRVYNAMKCRGYGAGAETRTGAKPAAADWIYAGAVCGFCAALRIRGGFSC